MYVLICIGNVNVPVKPEGYQRYYTGDVLEAVPDVEAEHLLRTFEGSFRVHRQYDSQDVKPEPVETREDVKLIAQLEKDSALLVENTDDVVVLPLDDDAHHSTVKAYVLDLEEHQPVDLAKVKAVKEKFASYKGVVAECDRILSAYSNTKES